MRRPKHEYELTALDRTKRAYLSAERNAKQASRRIASAFATAAGTAGVGLLGREIVQTGIAFERYERTLRAVTGSQAAATREFQFVTETARRLGLELGSATDQYAKLAAAANGTALAGDQTREIFTAVAEAATVLGLSADQTSGALTAIQQIISKGTVSAEELRGQLGERLPGAFQIAARSIGVTTQELDKLLRNGELAAEDLLPKLAQELRDTFGSEVDDAANGTQAAFNRLRTEIQLLSKDIADDLNPALVGGSEKLSTWLQLLREVREGQRLGFGAARDDLEGRILSIDAQIRSLEVKIGQSGRNRRSGQSDAQLQEQIDELNRQRGLLVQEQQNPGLSSAEENFANDVASYEAEISAINETRDALMQLNEVRLDPRLRERADELSKRAEALREFASIYDATRTPVERLRAEIDKLRESRQQLIAAGIDEADISDVLIRKNKELTDAISGTIESVETQSEAISNTFEQILFQGFEQGTEGMVRAWDRALKRMLAQAFASKLADALGLGGTTSGSGTESKGSGNFLKDIFGFKDGGEFMVGGGGGIDSRLVAFKASPNEKVTVTKPGQSAGGGMQFKVVNNIDARGASEERILSILPPILEANSQRTIAEVKLMKQRGRL